MENCCVCCGAIIPEGRMVCPICEMDADEADKLKKGLCEREDVPETLREAVETLLAGGK